jgi:signal transduction histidine kinase/CheY-like chemotaxis protein
MKLRIAAALLLPFLAAAVQWLLWDAYIKPYVWFLFFPAAFFSAQIGGLIGGLGATFIGATLVWYCFIPPQFSFQLQSTAAAFSIGLFVIMGSLFAVFFERLQRAMRRTDAALAETQQANAKITELYEKTLELDTLKSQFFANVSHELRTPLTLIMGPLTQRLANTDLSEEQRRDDERMLRNARLLYRQVSDLLDAAKLEAGRMGINYASANLSELVRNVSANFGSLGPERGIDFVVEAPESAPAEIDTEKVQRILLNLLANAFKFTPDGGQIRVRLTTDTSHALLEVEDNGPGIPVNMHEAVFERFRQVEGGSSRRHGGTGLGLAIVKEFVDLHDGAVSVSDSPGGGALFQVRLPLKGPQGCMTSAPATNVNPSFQEAVVNELRVIPKACPSSEAIDGPLVLVVEDNRDMNAFVVDILRPHYRVATAFDGREGLKKALNLAPDLIVCDLMMPVMSGNEMVEELRRRPQMANVPIVVLSAKADDDTRVRLFHAGAQGYLAKPFNAEELLARVGGLIKSRQVTIEQLQLSAARLRRLAEVVERIAAVRDLPSLMAIVRSALRQLTGADGVTLVFREDGYCHYVDEDAIGPLWKGQRFPLKSCISGWAMLHQQSVVIEDIYADPRVPHEAYRPTFIKSLAMAPVGRRQPKAAIGCYWAERHLASTEELELQQALADAMSVGLANLELIQQLSAEREKAVAAAAELRESQERLQLFIEHAPAALAMFDRDMRYLAVSHRWLGDYGLEGRHPRSQPLRVVSWNFRHLEIGAPTQPGRRSDRRRRRPVRTRKWRCALDLLGGETLAH